MKKIILLTGLVFLFLYGNAQKDIYLDYTNKVINYEFELKNINKIKSPFYEVVKYTPEGEKMKKTMQIKKRVKITLLSIFGSQAYIKVEEYLGAQLTKSYRKWLKIGDKIYDCKLNKVTPTDVIFKCSYGILFKTINKKIPMLRDKQ